MPFSYSLWAQAPLKLSRQKFSLQLRGSGGSASHSLGPSLENILDTLKAVIFRLFHRGSRVLGWAPGTAQGKTSGSGLLVLGFPQAALFLFCSWIKVLHKIPFGAKYKTKMMSLKMCENHCNKSFSPSDTLTHPPRAVSFKCRFMYFFSFKEAHPCFLFRSLKHTQIKITKCVYWQYPKSNPEFCTRNLFKVKIWFSHMDCTLDLALPPHFWFSPYTNLLPSAK